MTRTPKMSGRHVARVGMAAIAAVVCIATVRPAPSRATPPTVPPRAVNLTYTPLPAWFRFESEATVNRWVDEDDGKAMRAHAYALWAALTSMTDQVVEGQKVPVYETWFDRDEALSSVVALAATREKVRRFEPPKQLVHTGLVLRRREVLRAAVARPEATLFDNVKYTKEIADQIRANRYGEAATLNTINGGWGAAPLADRKIKDFPDTSVMLKPTYVAVSGTAPTRLGYWAGAANSTSPSTPDPGTWTRQMWFVPAGVDPASFDHQGLPVVGADQFFAIRLSAAEAASLGDPSIKAGDLMLLVAMHVSSREIPNWTWQTFWWSFEKPKVPEAAYTRVKAPFDHYGAAIGYAFTTGPDNPDGLNVVCFNPYLEAGFDSNTFAKPGQLGIESNCMSCHRLAAWPPAPVAPRTSPYIANGLIDAGDPFYFTGNTKTDFLWGIPFGAR